MNDLKTFSSSLKSVISMRRFIGYDPKLERYAEHNLEEYIAFCCDNSHLIEAYVLCLQYSEDLIVTAIKVDEKINNTDALKVISILAGVKIISEKFKSLFFQTNDTRNNLVHKMIKNPKEVTKLSTIKAKEHKKRLLDLIGYTEKFYLDFVKPEMKSLAISPQASLTKLQVERVEAFGRIIAKQTAREVDIATDSLDEATWKERFKSEYLRIYREKHEALLK